MGTLPDVSIIQTNGNLGGVVPSADGVAALVVTGVAVAGQFALGDIIGPFTSLAEFEAKGIDQAYDTANTCLAWRHINDFYSSAGEGSKLYVMVLADTITMAQICDKANNYAAKILQQAQGDVKLIGITLIPDTVGTISDQFEADLLAAIVKAQELRDFEFASPRHRHVQFLLEGRNFQGSASTAKDFRTMDANRCSVVISQDKDVAGLDAAYANYANVGYVLGWLASMPVNRSIARVKSGPIAIGSPALSNGTLIKDISDANQETLNAKGMIFVKKHAGKDGYFFNDDHTCAPLTDDYCYINHGRTMDKASHITYLTYLEELNDEIDVDKVTGRLAVATSKQFQGLIEKAINDQMTSLGEISGVTALVDPLQNVQSTNKIKAKISITRKGTSRQIEAELGFTVAQ